MNDLWDTLSQMMLKPMTKEFAPHRPEAVICLHRESMMLLKSHLKNVQIEMVTHETIEPLDECFEDLTHTICREDLEMTSLSRIEDATQNELEQFYQSASDFYKQAPWLLCGHERGIRIEAPWMREKPFFAIVMGSLGMTPGISLYHEEKDLRLMMGDRDVRDLSVIEKIYCSSIRYDYPQEMSAVDVINVERHGFAIPGPNLYPNLMHIKPGRQVSVSPHELLLLFITLCKAIPAFIAAREQNQDAPFEYTSKGETPRSVQLSWMQDVPGW